MIEFITIARVRCDNAPCTETAELTARATLDDSSCGWSGCGCVVGEMEIADARGWAELTEGRIHCPACWENQFRFER